MSENCDHVWYQSIMPPYEIRCFKCGTEKSNVDATEPAKENEIGLEFEKEFGTRSDYFNHRVGLFMDMRKWVEEKVEALQRENKELKEENEELINEANEWSRQLDAERLREAQQRELAYQANKKLDSLRDRIRESLTKFENENAGFEFIRTEIDLLKSLLPPDK